MGLRGVHNLGVSNWILKLLKLGAVMPRLPDFPSPKKTMFPKVTIKKERFQFSDSLPFFGGSDLQSLV